MSDDDLERLLADSFDRQARASVGDRSVPPRPRFLDAPTMPRRHRAARVFAPLAAAAAVVAVVVGVAVVQRGSSPSTGGTAAAPVVHTAAVHVRLINAAHSVVGVGMPIVADFSEPITDASALAHVTALTINGKPAHGAWYFEKTANPSFPIEGHFRLPSFWPADSKISLRLPIKSLSAGRNYAYDNSLGLDFATGPAQIVTVDDAHHDLVLTRDGQPIEKARVSLGAPSTPTQRGVKVIMAKAESVCMSGPDFHQCGVKFAQRLTDSGEYLHAAPWNTKNIEQGVDTSNGCTNLTDEDAKRLYAMLRVGDVVNYPNATGPAMSLSNGYGDWNVPWSTWITGGAVPTS